MAIKSNYIQAIKWIDKQLDQPTKQIKIGCETILDLNYSLAINRKQILENSEQLSYSAFGRTKKIKDYLQLSK
jgi:hypothetical protein